MFPCLPWFPSFLLLYLSCAGFCQLSFRLCFFLLISIFVSSRCILSSICFSSCHVLSGCGFFSILFAFFMWRFHFPVWSFWNEAKTKAKKGNTTTRTTMTSASAAALCVAVVAHGANLCFTWQAWHLATSTFVLRGRCGTYGTGLARA